jgi:hypothetical protein
MPLYLLQFIGAFLKWSFNRFKTKFKDELYGHNKYFKITNFISVEVENIILGLITLLLILSITLFLMLVK